VVIIVIVGKKLVECLLEGKKSWPKSLPKITDHDMAVEVASLLLLGQMFHRSEKVEGKKGYLVVSSIVMSSSYSMIDELIFRHFHL
jgi:hypothetical protein